MNEYNIGYTFIGGLVGLAVASLLYMMGGRNNKGIRRFGASFISMATVCICAFLLGRFSLLLLLVYPFKILEYVQGYSDDEGFGWLKRIGVAMTSTFTCSLVVYIIGGSWWCLAIQIPLSLSTVLFSRKNPFFAAAEEPLICLLNNIGVMASVFFG